MDVTSDWIVLERVTKDLKGKRVLSEIQAGFSKGMVYGITGENGSGKTMLLRAIAGFLHLSSGRILYAQQGVTKGVLIENPGFLPNETGLDNLKFLARIRNVLSEEEIRQAMEAVGLDPEDGRKTRAYSLGMKQKLGIAQAIMERPDMLLLDEPFRGIDGKSLTKIRQLLADYHCQGGTIFITGHDAAALAPLCDALYQMESGCLRRLGGDGERDLPHSGDR